MLRSCDHYGVNIRLRQELVIIGEILSSFPSFAFTLSFERSWYPVYASQTQPRKPIGGLLIEHVHQVVTACSDPDPGDVDFVVRAAGR